MMDTKRPRGRPGRYAKFEAFEASLPSTMAKRPLYCEGIGLFRGMNAFTVWLKLKLPRGGAYKGRTIPAGGTVEHKLGKRASWTWSQLVAERDRMQGLADRGEPLEDLEVPTFGKYATDWLARKKPMLKGYGVTSGHITAALSPAFGRKALNAIAPEDVSRWIAKQRVTLKPATVQRQLSTLNAILNDAVRNGIIDRNPTLRADKIRGIEPRQRFITEEEWQIILAKAVEIEKTQENQKERTPQQKRGWLRHYIVWAYNSGMRRAEILNLEFSHVRKLADGHTVVEVGNTKSGKPRFVTCTEEMESIIVALRKLERDKDDNRLFPVSMTTLKRTLTRLWKETGVADIRLHDLRRTHATILIQKNIDPRTVAGRLGHSGTAMLSRHYAVDRGDLEAARAFANEAE